MTRNDLTDMLLQSLDMYIPDQNPPSAAVQSRLDYIGLCIDSAIGFIRREGIVLPDIGGNYTQEEAQLIVMYASWLYRKRGSAAVYQPVDKMPRMLRYALNNLLISQKGAVENGI